MFMKPFRVKSNTQLRNSERKKFKLWLVKEFPRLEDSDIDELVPQGSQFFLLHLIAHGGQSVALYTVEKTPLIFEFENVLYPTVYMLWKVPYLLPALTVWSQLLEKIVKGADLMLPGVVIKGSLHPSCYGRFEQGDRLVINMTDNRAPIAIGRAALSSYDMYMAARRGKAIKVLHAFGDKLWEFGPKIEIVKLGPPAEYEKTTPSTSETETDSVLDSRSEESLTSNEGHDTSPQIECLSNLPGEFTTSSQGDSVTSTKSSVHLETESSRVTESSVELCSAEKDENIISEELKHLNVTNITVEQTILEEVNEMDKLLEYCFLKGLKTAVKKVFLPLLTSNFYKLHMIPACPLGSQLDIKKSSFKKLSKFLNAMEKTGVVKLKEFSKGVESIVYVDQNHQMLRDFVDLESSQISKTSPSVPKPSITEMYTVTAAVLPVLSTFGLRKGEMLNSSELRKHITEYVKKEKLQDPHLKSLVNVNDALRKVVQDPYTMAVTWEDLIGLFISHMSHGYMMNLSGEISVSHRGKLEPIDIQVGRRTGNKKVTLINNLEVYGINLQQFAKECQHGVAASTSISTVPGKKSQQLLVQGNQVLFIGNLLINKYQIPKRYLRGLENAPRPKK